MKIDGTFKTKVTAGGFRKWNTSEKKVPAKVKEFFRMEKEADTILAFLQEEENRECIAFPVHENLPGVYAIFPYLDNGVVLLETLYFVRIEPDLSFLGLWEGRTGNWIRGVNLKR